MRILMIEDEASVARRTERMLQSILDDRLTQLKIIGQLEAAQAYLATEPIDLLLLDLNLSGQDGFRVLQSVVAEAFDTIIISAYRDKAIEAFEYGVLDFVAKPFDQERLAKALHRLLDKRANNEHHLKRLAIKKEGRVQLIEVTDIRYIKGANVYSELHLTSGRRVLSNKSLERLARLLPPHFERVHKSYVVDMHACQEIIIQPGSQYRLRLDDDTLIPLGRTRYKEIKAKYFA
ncbi:MAG: response regulator [Bacteroidota bacterium]